MPDHTAPEPARPARLTPIRLRVDGIADQRRGWYTEPVRDLAVRLADAMLTAAAAVHPAATFHQFTAVTNIAAGCVDVARTVTDHPPVKLSSEDRMRLLDRLVGALRDRLVFATRYGFAVALDEQPGPVMRRWPHRLVIALSGVPAWSLCTDGLPDGLVPVCAPFTPAGATGVADMVAALVAGGLPDPFKGG